TRGSAASSARRPSNRCCSAATTNWRPPPPCITGWSSAPSGSPASAWSPSPTPKTAPPGPVSVLFLCGHNAGRSQMTLSWVTHLAGGRAIAWSGGSDPVANIEPGAIAAMAEVSIDISGEFSKPWTDDFVLDADVVVTMGCGDACPLLPGKHYEDWELDDP